MIFYKKKRKNNFLVIKKRMLPFLFPIGLMTNFLAFPVYGVDISVPIGAEGYLGELAPPVSVSIASYKQRDAYYGARGMVFFSYNAGSAGGLKPEIDKKIGYTGFKVNNASSSNGAYILLVPTGTITVNYTTYNGTNKTGYVRFNHGKTVAADGMVSLSQVERDGGELSFGLLPHVSSDLNFFRVGTTTTVTANISSYGLYASGPLIPGKYTFSPLKIVQIQTTDGMLAQPVILDANRDVLNINALKACNVSPQSMTTVNYANQFAKTYSTPTKLTENIASVNVDCPYAGNVHLTIKPFNDLVEGSNTGMVLTGTKAQESGKSLPYVVTSLEGQQQSAICQPNASEALSYLGSTKIGASMPKNFNQTLYFNLCANGNIASDRYSGSLDVTFLIE